MIRDLFVFYIIVIYFFFAVFPLAAYGFLSAISIKYTCDPEPIKAILNIVLLVGAEVAFSVTQIVNCVQKIGFTAAIRPGYTGHRGLKVECRRRIVAELEESYFIYSVQSCKRKQKIL